jgi:pimeloyl-ACP methyl ester carboxylesterase
MTVELNDDDIGATSTALAGSRTVAWTEYGKPTGKPMAYFHGAGASRLEAGSLAAAAAAAGLRVISIDRPGCGKTDPMIGRTLLDSVSDLGVVLDALGIDSVVVAGLSAGAMYAWAAAERFPERVRGVVCISPAIPCDRPEVRAALGAQFKLTALLANRLPGVLASMLRKQFNQVSGPNGQRNVMRRMKRISPADVAVLADPQNFADYLASSTEGRRQGNWGNDEFVLMTNQWGFDPASQTVPCTLIHGDRDPLTPGIVRWVTMAPNIRVNQVAGGHLLTATDIGRAAVIDAVLTVA